MDLSAWGTAAGPGLSLGYSRVGFDDGLACCGARGSDAAGTGRRAGRPACCASLLAELASAGRPTTRAPVLLQRNSSEPTTTSPRCHLALSPSVPCPCTPLLVSLPSSPNRPLASLRPACRSCSTTEVCPGLLPNSRRRPARRSPSSASSELTPCPTLLPLLAPLPAPPPAASFSPPSRAAPTLLAAASHSPATVRLGHRHGRQGLRRHRLGPAPRKPSDARRRQL